MKNKFFILFFFFLAFPVFSKPIEYSGKTVDKISKKSLENVRIRVLPEETVIFSRKNGFFLFSSGQEYPKITFIFEKEGYLPLSLTNPENEFLAELSPLLSSEGEKIEVRAKKQEKEKSVSQKKLSQETMKNTTANSLDDALVSLNALPGVVSKGYETSLSLRGGDRTETSYYYEGFPLFYPFMLGNVSSIYQMDLVQSLNLYSGSFPASFGNTLSGLVNAELNFGDKPSLGFLFHLSLITFRSVIEKKDFLFSFNRTYYDLVLSQLDSLKGYTLPYYYDFHLRKKIQLDENNVLKLFGFYIHEGAEIISEENKMDLLGGGKKFYYHSNRLFLGSRLYTYFSENLSFENALSYCFQYADHRYVQEDTNWFRLAYHHFLYQGKASFHLNPKHLINLGIETSFFLNSINSRFLTENFFNADDSLFFSYNSKLFIHPAFYLEEEGEWVKNFLFIRLGIRSEWFNMTKKWIFDPRLNLRLSFTDFWNLKLGAGIFSQYPGEKEAGNWRYFDKKKGNLDLKPEKAYHLTFGNEIESEKYLFRTEVFGKYYKDLVNKDLASNYLNGTIGYAYGLEVWIEKKAGDHWDGWISYTYLKSMRKVTERISAKTYYRNIYTIYSEEEIYQTPFQKWYPADFDLRHKLNLTLNYTISGKWRISLTQTLFSGSPYNTMAFEHDILVERVNNQYLPYQYRTDIKLAMPFFFENAGCFIQVLNLLNKTNIADYDYILKNDGTNISYTPKKLIDYPRFFIFGITAEF